VNITAVAILENPRAGKGRSAKLAMWLKAELQSRSIPADIYKNSWPDHFEAYSDVWLIGGDGTINYFINRYPGCDKALVLFKGGTGNDFAWKLYGDKNDAGQLDQVLHALPRKVDAGNCNGYLFINCLGIGFDGEIVRSMKSIRLLGGHIGYLLAVVLKIFGFREHRFSIVCNREKWEDRFLLVMVVNSSRAGGGFLVAPGAAVDDGKLDMVLCRRRSLLKRLKYLPVIKKGKHLELPFIIHRTSNECSISCDAIMDIQADGELINGKELQISILPGKFLFRY
jgi:YegS/Rv2252/BmrU family lipid kinase